ncbi:MAG: hypothetical protein ABI862_11235 [Ilumatobacteraceae bacterium]
MARYGWAMEMVRRSIAELGCSMVEWRHDFHGYREHSSGRGFDDANLEVGMAFWVGLVETQLAGTMGGSTS